MKNLIKHLLMVVTVCNALVADALPKLNSYPTAAATIFLDFDGQTVKSSVWNNGNTLVCAPSGMTDAQITEVFNRVAEDYRPFNINITTDSTVFMAAPLNKRMRVIVTPTSSWRTGVGGITYVGSFTWGDDTPCFVFCDRLGPNNPKYVGECCSHESGHSLGLSHQSTYNSNCQLVDQYCTGNGSGETGWAPIMGNSYYQNMTGWDVGPTQYGCTMVQDNLAIITSQNGFTYRTDDYSDIIDNNTTLAGSNSFDLKGLIATNTDKDAMKFVVTQSANFHFEATPFSLSTTNKGANLDIKLELYNDTKTLIRTYDPLQTLSIVADTNLQAGTYYFILTGTGNMNVDDYGSLGSYTFVALRGTLPIHNVTLNGNNNNNKHNLNWSVIADEPIKSQTLEVSSNGSDFVAMTELSATAKTFSYAPNASGNLYYRIKVISTIDQIAYSNTISLKSNKPETKYLISTLVSSSIRVDASNDYRYRLTDANGRMLAQGIGRQGINQIDVSNRPGGMYLLQIISNNEIKTERIIKQ